MKFLVYCFYANQEFICRLIYLRNVEKAKKMPSSVSQSERPLADFLCVEGYNEAEENACSVLPNRIIEEARPFLFNQLGYPTRIEQDRAAWRFADTMHETRFAGDVKGRLRGLTDEELELFCTVNQAVAALSERLYGRRVFTTSSFVRALNVYRHIRALYPEKGTIVLEVGPGSGYLGALLMLSGYRYIATDITQGFYLYQNHLWTWLFGKRFHDLAKEPARTHDVLARDDIVGLHLPWWDYMTLYRDPEVLTVDVVTANHMLCEMTRLSRRYTVKMARGMLSRSTRRPSFLFEGWGYDLVTSTYEAYRGFRWNGFELRHEDDDIVLFEPVNDTYTDPAPLRDMMWAYLKQRGQNAPPQPLPEMMIDRKGDWTEQILESRRRVVPLAVHDVDAVRARLRETLGIDDLRTPDEEFYAFLGHAV